MRGRGRGLTLVMAIAVAAGPVTLMTASPASAAPVSKSNTTAAVVTNGSVERTVEFTTSDFPSTSVVTDIVVQLDLAKIDNTGSGTSPTCGPPPVNGTLNERNDNLGYDLRSPAGTTISLIAFATYQSTGFNGRITVTLDDAAASSVGGVLSAGTFRPSQPLSGLDAELAIGTWTVIPKNAAGAGVDPVCHYGFTLTLTAEVPPKVSQSITFDPAATGVVAGSQVLTATATSGLPVGFSIDASSDAGVCELNGSTLEYPAAGTCVVNADQAGNDGYLAAPQVQKSVEISLGTFTPGPTASISGTPRQGQTLIADEASPDPTPDSLAYKWFADGVQIAGETADTLLLTSAQVGKKIRVEVIAAAAGYTDAADMSSETVPVVGIFTPGPAASISGFARIGSTLTAGAGSPSPTPSTLGYRWFADGVQLSSVVKTLKLTSAHHGKRIQVRVYAIRAGYLTATNLSPATARVSSLQAKVISMELNDYTVARGQRVTAEIELLASREPFSIVLDGKKLVSGNADTDGVARTSFVIPTNAIRGTRTLRAYGAFPDRTDPDIITIR